MKYFDSYHLPSSLDEALALLSSYGGRARVVAGGTDLLLDLPGNYNKGERPHYDALIDVTRLTGADEITEDGETVVIGCGVTHAAIVDSPIIRARAAALADASAVVGGPQVRNVATLIGNVAHALPAADGTVALMALDAEAQVAGKETSSAESWRPLSSLFLGPGKSAVDPSKQVITAIRFRGTRAGEGSAFARIMRPQGVALPILAMAARVSVSHGQVSAVGISAGPVAAVPARALKTETFLLGKPVSPEVVRQAASVLSEEAAFRTSPHRASREYRQELLPVLLDRVLKLAVERAGGA